MGVKLVRAVRSGVVIIAMLVTVPGWGLRETPEQSTFSPTQECKDIKLLHPGVVTSVRDSVLQQMCLRASTHVDVTPTFKQFAVFMLHRDDFDEFVSWHSGDAKDVINNPYWAVNDLTVLTSSKYRWYVHGLPMWPLPFQALDNRTTTKKPFGKTELVDWPNYGLATPIYFVSKAWRDQTWSVEEFFQQEEKKKKKKKSPFKNLEAFHKLALKVVAAVNGTHVESYSEWPFLKLSLPLMLRSMIQRNKGICPDELYVYLRYQPCYPLHPAQDSCLQVIRQAYQILSSASCPTTTVVVGYSKKYSQDDPPL